MLINFISLWLLMFLYPSHCWVEYLFLDSPPSVVSLSVCLSVDKMLCDHFVYGGWMYITCASALTLLLFWCLIQNCLWLKPNQGHGFHLKPLIHKWVFFWKEFWNADLLHLVYSVHALQLFLKMPYDNDVLCMLGAVMNKQFFDLHAHLVTWII